MNTTACITILVKDFFCGVKDSLIGIRTVNKIDDCIFSEQKNVPIKASTPKISTLARKRAEKLNLSTSNEENTVLITKQK